MKLQGYYACESSCSVFHFGGLLGLPKVATLDLCVKSRLYSKDLGYGGGVMFI